MRFNGLLHLAATPATRLDRWMFVERAWDSGTWFRDCCLEAGISAH